MGNTSNNSSNMNSPPQGGQSQTTPQSPSQSSPGQQKPSSPNQGGNKPASDRDTKRSAQISPDNIQDVGQGEDGLGDESESGTSDSPGSAERNRTGTQRSQVR